jgi:ribose 5-phosphate isomerase A
MSGAREAAKERAGRRAADYVESGMRVGLGTGSTVHFTILALGERKPDVVCVATSERTRRLASELGLRVAAPDEVGRLDLAIDGADEVDPDLNLVKGGGGAHAREKIVARMAARFIVVVDEAKLVERLGAFGLPLEALPFAPGVVAEQVRALGAARVTRREALSDNGNVLLHAHFGPIADPPGLARALDEIPGLVEHGLFPGAMVERVVVAGAAGLREIERPRGPALRV